MKVESIQAARAAYDIEAQCILEMKDYFDEDAFAAAVALLAKAPRIGAAALSVFRTRDYFPQKSSTASGMALAGMVSRKRTVRSRRPHRGYGMSAPVSSAS